jgi:hypothetical protein
MFIINVTQSTFPLVVEFNVCRFCLVENLHSNSISNDSLLPLVIILKAGSHPKALIRLQFLPSGTINTLLTDYS